MRASLLISLFLILLLHPPVADARRVSANTQKLYDTLAEASDRYREGLALIRRGETTSGREATRAAAARLLEAGRRCQDTRGCEGARFLAAYDALVQEGAELAAGGEGFGARAPENGLAGESAVLVSMPEAGRSVALLKGQDLRELIELNEPVKAALAEWLTCLLIELISSDEDASCSTARPRSATSFWKRPIMLLNARPVLASSSSPSMVTRRVRSACSAISLITVCIWLSGRLIER